MKNSRRKKNEKFHFFLTLFVSFGSASMHTDTKQAYARKNEEDEMRETPEKKKYNNTSFSYIFKFEK